MQTKEIKELILIGHYHHHATCLECKSVAIVESYYEQLTPLTCPSCNTEMSVSSTLQKEIFTDSVIKCATCGCGFTIDPLPEKIHCPVCGTPMEMKNASSA